MRVGRSPPVWQTGGGQRKLESRSSKRRKLKAATTTGESRKLGTSRAEGSAPGVSRQLVAGLAGGIPIPSTATSNQPYPNTLRPEIRDQAMSRGGKLAPEVNRALFVKNLSYNVTPEELFDLFGKFGPIRQVRQGIANNTKGTAFVVYEDVMDAKQACDKLNGFNFQNRYLVVLYHQPEKMARSKEDLEARKENLEQLKKQHGIE